MMLRNMKHFLTTSNKKEKANNTACAQANCTLLTACVFRLPKEVKHMRSEMWLVLVNLHFTEVLIKTSSKFARKHTCRQQETYVSQKLEIYNTYQ